MCLFLSTDYEEHFCWLVQPYMSQWVLWAHNTKCGEAASMKLQRTLKRGAQSLGISEPVEDSLHSSYTLKFRASDGLISMLPPSLVELYSHWRQQQSLHLPCVSLGSLWVLYVPMPHIHKEKPRIVSHVAKESFMKLLLHWKKSMTSLSQLVYIPKVWIKALSEAGGI